MKKILITFSLSLLVAATIFSLMFASEPNDQKEKRNYINYTFSVLDSYADNSSNYNSGILEISDYEKLYISFIDNNEVICSRIGEAEKDTQNRIKEDINDIIDKCYSKNKFDEVIKNEEIDDLDIVFKFLFNRQYVENKDELQKELELGVHSIELEKDNKSVYLSSFYPIFKSYQFDQTMEKICDKLNLHKNCYNNEDVKVFLFNTVAFKGNREGEIDDLYRFNLPLEINDIDDQFLLNRIKIVGSWFKNNFNHEIGTLEYEYHPSNDEYSEDNNDVRQIASIWAMASLRNFLKDDSFKENLHAAIDTYIRYTACEGDFCYLLVDGSAKLAYNAFIILALIETEDYLHRDIWLELLANGIIELQQEDGSYKTNFNSGRISGVDYYPGEAMLSLMRLYEATKDRKYLDSVIKAYDYYPDYWRENKNTAFIPWHSQTYLHLYNATKKKEIADFVFEMNDWLIANHQILESDYPDKIGGFPKSHPRNSTASYLEGLTDAYLLAQIVNDEYHEELYKNAIQLAIKCILLMQYTEDNTFYIKNQDRAVGGFKSSLYTNEQRIDFTQHAMFAVMKAYKYGVFN